MGNPRGFMDIKRVNPSAIAPTERIKHYKEFYHLLDKKSQELQGGRCMDCGVAFCHTGIHARAQQKTHLSECIAGGDIGCPLKNLIPEWNDLIYRGLWDAAYHRLSLTNPFPEFTGRVCPAPCEDSCVCAINGDPVAIKSNEQAIIENAFENNLVVPFVPKSRTLHKIAIVGSGPAGLACAWELNKYGHNVTVFERSDRIGGLLMYGIPDMKLEKRYINRRVEIMQKSGIEFIPKHPIDDSKAVAQLLESFDYIVLATGASAPIDLPIAGRELGGIMFAVDYLTKNTKSLLDKGVADTLAKDKNVLVIGSGDTSVDCIAVAVRQGARHITRFERSPKRSQSRLETNPWPLKKNTFSTDYGLQEAIEVFGRDVREYQKLTKEFVGSNGTVSGVLAVDLEYLHENGKNIRHEIPKSQREYKADLVLLAMGFSGTESKTAEAFDVQLSSRSNIITHHYQTSNPKIFACGDAKMGQSLVVWAIRDGMQCAHALHRMYLI